MVPYFFFFLSARKSNADAPMPMAVRAIAPDIVIAFSRILFPLILNPIFK
jgi:hypothetical protein